MGNILTQEAGTLFTAISEGNVDGAIRALGARPGLSHKHAGSKGRTLYHACASNGQVTVLKRLCEYIWQTLPDEMGKVHEGEPPEGRSHPIIYRAINSYDTMGCTPLILACKKGHPNVVEYLLTQGADPWIGDRLMCCAPLHHAARYNNHQCIEAILRSPFVEHIGKVRTREHKLVDYPNNAGYTPLHYAATCRSADAAAALFRHGANPNARTWDVGFDFIQLEEGSTPLHAASRCQNLDMAMLLITYWVDNLRKLGITDPRVVENYQKLKPYQLAASKTNKALYRVLDPATPVKEISDPFGVGGREHILLPASKAAPLDHLRSVQARQDSNESRTSDGSDWFPRDKVTPGCGDDQRTGGGDAGVAKAQGTAPDFITVYRCAEFIPDADSSSAVPPSSTHEGTTGLFRQPSQSKRGPPGTTSQPINQLNRTRSSAIIPVRPAVDSTQRLQRTGSLPQPQFPQCSFSNRSLTVSGPKPGRTKSDPDKYLVGDGSKPVDTKSSESPQRNSTSPSPVSCEQLASPTPQLPTTPPRSDSNMAFSGTLKNRSLSVPLRPGGGTDAEGAKTHRPTATAATTSTSTSSTYGITAAVTAAALTKPPSPDMDTVGRRSLTKQLSLKASALRGGSSFLNGGVEVGGLLSAEATPAPPTINRSLSRRLSRQGSSPTGMLPAAPPQVMTAWGELTTKGTSSSASQTAAKGTNNTSSNAKGKASMPVVSEPDFTRDSHAEDSQPVEITMYPHTREFLQRLR